MYKDISQLIIFQANDDCILKALSEIDLQKASKSKEEVTFAIYAQIKQLLEEATRYGFEDNLWQCYLTMFLLMHENSFTLTCERNQVEEGSIKQFVLHDLAIFQKLFHYDFSEWEKTLSIDCFSIVTNYKTITKRERMYNHVIAHQANNIRNAFVKAKDSETMYQILTAFYQQYGVGMFGLNKAFRMNEGTRTIQYQPINNLSTTRLEDLVGYESQKQELVANTEAFIAGRPCNNVLLYGEAGTGKSTSIKAIVAKYYDQGLRMIEIYKHQFKDLSAIINQIKNRNYRFIIYMDDLSFEEHETEYKFLKAIIEGGVEVRPDNILIYATSNRRHLIKESWRDRNDTEINEDMHVSETMQEKLSLVARFGISIYYGKPTAKEYHTIVKELAHRHPQITLNDDELWKIANRWELTHGGESGRCAQQLIDYLLSSIH